MRTNESNNRLYNLGRRYSCLRYWGIHSGLTAAFETGGESFFNALLPTIGLRLGWVEHLYLSAELFDFQFLQFYNTAPNLRLPSGRLWLQAGAGGYFDDYSVSFARIQYGIPKGLIFHTQVRYGSYVINSADMIGLGKRFGRYSAVCKKHPGEW